MREAKARGEITRFPGGRRAKGLPPLSRDPKIRKAQRIIETAMAEKEEASAAVQKPWSEMSRGEKLEANATDALTITARILRLGVDPTNTKLLAIVKDTALSLIGYQIRVEQGPQPFSPPAAPSISVEELRRQAEEEITAAFKEWSPPAAIERLAVDAKPILPDPTPPALESEPKREIVRQYAAPEPRVTRLSHYRPLRPYGPWGT
jgi:hypothetical protein